MVQSSIVIFVYLHFLWGMGAVLQRRDGVLQNMPNAFLKSRFMICMSRYVLELIYNIAGFDSSEHIIFEIDVYLNLGSHVVRCL